MGIWNWYRNWIAKRRTSAYAIPPSPWRHLVNSPLDAAAPTAARRCRERPVVVPITRRDTDDDFVNSAVLGSILGSSVSHHGSYDSYNSGGDYSGGGGDFSGGGASGSWDSGSSDSGGGGDSGGGSSGGGD